MQAWWAEDTTLKNITHLTVQKLLIVLCTHVYHTLAHTYTHTHTHTHTTHTHTHTHTHNTTHTQTQYKLVNYKTGWIIYNILWMDSVYIYISMNIM